MLGFANEPRSAARLHDLSHDGKVEFLALSREDALRKRLRAITDKGTECLIALARDQKLEDGVILELGDRAVVVRMTEERWLALQPRDETAALELGYFCGNLHWRVRFGEKRILVAMEGPEEELPRPSARDACRRQSDGRLGMSDSTLLLRVLQDGDSFFPSGAVSFSWGLEMLCAEGAITCEQDVEAFLLAHLHHRWAQFDRPVVIAAALGSNTLAAVVQIDQIVEAHTLGRRVALRLTPQRQRVARRARRARNPRRRATI